MDTRNSSLTKSKNSSDLTPVQKFIRGSLRKQYQQIVIGERKMFNYESIAHSAKSIFLKDILNEETFLIHVGKFYKKEKKMWLNKNKRYDNNTKLKELDRKYPNVNIFLLAKYMMLKDKFSLQSKKDFETLEDIILLSNGKKLHYSF